MILVLHSLTGPIQPSNDLRLKFYGYYKQATIGKCTAAQPWAVDFVNKAKWFVVPYGVTVRN